jgi:hypothetical protein
MPMIVSVPYGDIVLPVDDAMALMKILEKSEKYRHKYNSQASTSSHHVFPMEDQLAARLISQDTYAMYKLAGKPED